MNPRVRYRRVGGAAQKGPARPPLAGQLPPFGNRGRRGAGEDEERLGGRREAERPARNDIVFGRPASLGGASARIAVHRATGAVTSWYMTDEKHEQERTDRNDQRSEEAHWQVAEAGVEEEERLSEAARQADEQQDDWENEGGALDREPRKTT